MGRAVVSPLFQSGDRAPEPAVHGSRIGEGENFLASDPALLGLLKVVYLQDLQPAC